jgi:hypothetical protein
MSTGQAVVSLQIQLGGANSPLAALAQQMQQIAAAQASLLGNSGGLGGAAAAAAAALRPSRTCSNVASPRVHARTVSMHLRGRSSPTGTWTSAVSAQSHAASTTSMRSSGSVITRAAIHKSQSPRLQLDHAVAIEGCSLHHVRASPHAPRRLRVVRQCWRFGAVA